MDTLVTSKIRGGDDGQDCVVTTSGKTVEIDDGDDIDTRRILPRNRDTAQNIYQVKEVIVSYEDRRNGEGSVGESTSPPPVRARQHI